MEVPFGKTWVVPVADLISVLIFITFSLLLAHFGILVATIKSRIALSSLFLFFMLSFPGFLRYLICHRWPPVEATIIESRYLSLPNIHSIGNVAFPTYEADIEYRIEGEIIRSSITSSKPFNKTIVIYYLPSNPQIFTRYKGMLWNRTNTFRTVVVVAITIAVAYYGQLLKLR